MITSVIVKIIGAVYKIPLTAFIGAVGRGYFASAYNICIPIHAITMGAFPIALSRLISSYNSKGDKVMTDALKKSAHRMFFVVGVVGMAIMLVFAKPYSVYIAKSPDSLLTILVLAPSVLFSCLAASYRGYYEGFMNMVPTSVSQTIEAVFKMLFGLLFAKITMSYMYNEYLETGTLFSQSIFNDAQALSVIYPYSSAAAIQGVTVGSFLSFVYVFIYSKSKTSSTLFVSKADTSLATKELLTFSFSIMVSCAVQSVFQFLDTASVQYSLAGIDPIVLKRAFSQSLSLNSVSDKDLVMYVYGLLNASLDFKNLVPGVTMALGVCAVPAISNAFEQKDFKRLKTLLDSIIKYTVMLSTFAGVFIAVESNSILNLFYSSSQDMVAGCNHLVKMFGVTVWSYCLAGVSVFCVQAVGKPQKSIAPYVLSGVVRVLLNLLLVSDENVMLYGCVISGFVGYIIIAVWNFVVFVKTSCISLDCCRCFVRPSICVALTLVLYKLLIAIIVLSHSAIVVFLIKFAIFSIIYVLLSIIFKNLEIIEIFYVIKYKKSGLNT